MSATIVVMHTSSDLSSSECSSAGAIPIPFSIAIKTPDGRAVILWQIVAYDAHDASIRSWTARPMEDYKEEKDHGKEVVVFLFALLVCL